MIRNKRLLGLINLMEPDHPLGLLTKSRPLASIPFGGRYRVVDFVLSNMTAAGIDTIGIYMKDKERSLMDHIRSGRPWDIDRMQGGIFYFTPTGLTNLESEVKGDVPNFYNNIDILTKSNCEYAVLSGSSMILNIDYLEVLDEHIKTNADITVVYKEYDGTSHYYDNAHILNTDDMGRIKSFGYKIVKTSGDRDEEKMAKVSMEMYIMKVSLLREIIEDAVSSGSSPFMREVLHESARVYNFRGYEFKGFIGYISSIYNYYNSSMDLLNEEHLLNLFYGPNRINTKVRNENPAYYAPESKVKNCLIANGCEIYGEVENSILFRRVKVEKGAKIKNSILMQNTTVMENADLDSVITDKGVCIRKGVNLKGHPMNPLLIEKETEVKKIDTIPQVKSINK